MNNLVKGIARFFLYFWYGSDGVGYRVSNGLLPEWAKKPQSREAYIQDLIAQRDEWKRMEREIRQHLLSLLEERKNTEKILLSMKPSYETYAEGWRARGGENGAVFSEVQDRMITAEQENRKLREALEIISKMPKTPNSPKNGPWTIAQQALNAQAAQSERTQECCIDGCHNRVPISAEACWDCVDAENENDANSED